ncbi:MAG: dTDP-glucose 4,6-dehydratase [Bdellovibrionales bacterium]|nr:dTDP-glucose 4,6-dehydratase [Bdellovibrionales bacterium]
MKTILVTGAAGFIGSNFVEIALSAGHRVIGYDALTYAGHRENLEEFGTNPNFKFIHANILDTDRVLGVLKENQVDLIAHFAAESHVDKSISGPGAFIETNVNGTFSMLTAARSHYESLSSDAKKEFRFLHVSTDEVFGTLGPTGKFSETTPYAPNSPYSASKAASDLLVRAWFHTYGLPTIITNCSNNYGPKQFPEKLIPHMIFCALQGKVLPVYGKGENIRDWIHVKDHARGVLLALTKGMPGETYCFGGNSERTNLQVVHSLCAELNSVRPRKDGGYESLIKFVTDRPGHDFRYAIDDSKAQRELGFTREYSRFEDGLRETIRWYLQNLEWSKRVISKSGAKTTYDWSVLSG